MGILIEYNGRHRVFSDPEALKIGLQLDQNAEERIFSCPRYLNGFDLSEFTCSLLLSGTGWTDRQELTAEETTEEFIRYRWVVPEVVTCTGRPVVFQPVFQKESVVIHLDKDIFVVAASIDVNSEIERCYPDYIDELKNKAEKSEVYRKDEIDAFLEEKDAQWQLLKNAGALPNLLINGDSKVWQRGESFSLSPSEEWQYCDDRWRYKLSGTGCSAVISKGEAGGVHIALAGNGTLTRQQVLEESVIGTLTSKIDGAVNSTAFSGNTVEQQFISSCTINWTKLEVGETFTPFSPRPIAQELADCQRYYLDCKNNAPVTMATGVSAAKVVVWQLFPVEMRTTPLVDIYDGVYGTNLNKIALWNDATRYDVTSVSAMPKGIIDIVTSGVSSGTRYRFYYIADAEIYD